MNSLKHVTKVEQQYISYGVLNIMHYYITNNIEYPEWLFSRFDKLPRCYEYVKEFCVELPWLKNDTTNLSYMHGEVTAWIIENLEYKWYKRNKAFYFENELDAMTFKLRWL